MKTLHSAVQCWVVSGTIPGAVAAIQSYKKTGVFLGIRTAVDQWTTVGYAWETTDRKPQPMKCPHCQSENTRQYTKTTLHRLLFGSAQKTAVRSPIDNDDA